MLVEATSVKTVADRVFNLLKGYGFQIDTYNKAGEVVGDPADAIRFFVEDPNLLVTLNVPKEEIRLSISDNSDQTDTLRKQLDEIAKDYLMMLDFRVFGKTLKPSSEAINIQRDADMKEQNELRRLAGLPLKEERTVVGCNDDQSLYIFLNDEMVDLGKTEEAIATKLHELGDRIDFDDMYYSSSMDFASECGFPNDDAAKELMDKAIDTYSEIKFKKVRHTSDKGPGRDATSDDIAKINRGEEVTEEEGVYANYVTYIGPNGEELGTEDYDGELGPDMMAQMASDEECKMLCDKHNIDYNDIVGCLKFDDGEATMQDGKELPDGTIAFYGGKEGSLKEEFSPLQQAYDKIYQLTDKMGDEALEQMDRYAPKFSDALEKHEDIETIEKREPQNVDFYIRELEDAEFQIGESFEESAPFGEPSEDDQMYQEMMDVYDKGGEPALAKHLGMSDKELDEEIDEWCRDNNKHPDDDRDEAIQGVCEDLIDNRDRKDYGSAMYDEALEELKKLAGLV